MARELLEYGPQFPDRYDQSDFSFRALVGADWPMRFFYRLENKATLVITIQVMGAPPFTRTIEGEGMNITYGEAFDLPTYAGKGPHAALISFKATRPGPNGNERADFRLLGAGAGEGGFGALLKGAPGLEVAALGSLPLGGEGRDPARASAPPRLIPGLSIYDTTLSATPGGYVYSFKVGRNSTYRKWAADIIENVRRNNSDVPRTVKNIKTVAQRIGPNQTKTGIWDGLNDRHKKVPPGRYSLFVRAWYSGYNAGTWNAVDDSDPIFVN